MMSLWVASAARALALKSVIERQDHLGEMIALVHETAGERVFLQSDAGALDALVGDDLVDQRERRRLNILPTEIEDIDIEGRRLCGRGRGDRLRRVWCDTAKEKQRARPPA